MSDGSIRDILNFLGGEFEADLDRLDVGDRVMAALRALPDRGRALLKNAPIAIGQHLAPDEWAPVYRVRRG